MKEINGAKNNDIKGIIFGAGQNGSRLMPGLQKYCGVTIVAVCDNDKDTWGGY